MPTKGEVSLNFIRKKRKKNEIDNMEKVTNNLPGFGFANKEHQLIMWNRYSTNTKVFLSKLDQYYYNLVIPNDQQKRIPDHFRYLKVKNKYGEIIFNVNLKSVRTKNLEVEETQQIVIPIVLSPSQVQLATLLINQYNLANLNNPSASLLEYLIFFPGVIPPLSEGDPFIIEGADLFFL